MNSIRLNQLRWCVIILLGLFITAGCISKSSGRSQPTVIKGTLDLRKWDFEKDGVVSLDGEWEFYWNQLLEPKDFLGDAHPTKVDYIKVPGNWNGQEISSGMIEGKGFATYRLLIKVNPGDAFYALKMLEAAHAFKLWVNEKESWVSGRVGKSRSEMKPQHIPRIAVFRPESDTIELLIQVSNFVHKKGGLWNPVELGTVEQVTKIREENLIIEFVLFGSIIIMGLYHLGLFFLRRKERSTLYFGLFCILVALRVIVTGERILHVYAPWLGWEMLVRIEYLTFYAGAPMFLIFLGKVFSDYSQLAIRIATAISSVFIGILLVTNPIIFSHTLPYFQILILIFCSYVLFIFIRAIVHKKEGAILINMGAVVLLLTLIYDILEANEYFFSIELAPFGLFFFIFVQSVMLSIRFSKAFVMAEELSNELERKVDQRTSWLRNANKEIRLSNDKLKETQAQLIQSQKMEAMGTLAGGIAHEFNNILGTMQGYTELMLDEEPEDSPKKKYLSAIYRSGERASDLVRQILTFSRGDQEVLIPQKIQPQLQEMLQMIRATLPDSITIEESIDPDCAPIMANQTQISQILVNLCTNAEHAMKGKGGQLEIELKGVTVRNNEYVEAPNAEGDYLQLRVRDTGVGIPEEIRERVFDPFFTTKEVDEGSGLGLSIVHGIVVNHLGFIQLESQFGQGTEIKIFFPTTEEIEEPVSETEIEPKPGEGHILIVEDDRELALFYVTTLENLGYTTTLFYDGLEALDHFKVHLDEYNLVFTDQILSGISGFEMSQEILILKPDIPIILSTGYSTAVTEEEALEAGIRCFLHKPVKITKLTRKIWELINFNFAER